MAALNSDSTHDAVVRRLRPHLLPLALLAAATFLVYGRCLAHQFLNWDDHGYVTANSAVMGLTAEHLRRAFSDYFVGNYAPVQIISYMADYALWGLRASGFIFTNILIHAANGMLFYALLLQVTGRRLWAFGAALVFLLHPVQVESVAWISQRKNLLAMLFFLAAFLSYNRYRECPPSPLSSGKRAYYALSVVLYVLALLSKSVAVVLPPALLVFDLCYGCRKSLKELLYDKIPYAIAAGAVALIALESQMPEAGGGRRDYYGGSPMATALTMVPVFVRYLGLMFWPHRLSAVYTPQVRTGVDAVVVLSALLLTAVLGAAIMLFRKDRRLFFWVALFFIGLLPVSQIVPIVTLMNDRYLYFPMLGGAAFVAGSGVWAYDRLRGTRRAAACAGLAVLLGLAMLSFQRAAVWKDSFTLWSDAYAKAPQTPQTTYYLADAYNGLGKTDEALRYYRLALKQSPHDRDILIALADLCVQTGRLEEAGPLLDELLRSNPGYAYGYQVMAMYHIKRGDVVRAEEMARVSVGLDPASPEGLHCLGKVYAARGNYRGALDLFHRALQLDPHNPMLWYNSACAEAAVDNVPEALAHLRRALETGLQKNPRAIANDPRLRPLTAVPEFENILRQR
ncbi:tetratricopeptide repeat protein [Geobacter sp. FeAm09]|uniref:tetratricopeptide repeat protein n=1 Tax=Geobacter sp. FeAm09 TaxID=2597769 RepID=UPI0011EC6E96|nr:tetratricopeptide repeat protein [Geobacter sp. FeAm09]QEM66782.1 tetratricopeptide repeat protein [Geobacter sp. FeAm09]